MGGRGMTRNLLATTVTLAILTAGAIIGLEAVGLLFQGEATVPIVASMQTDEDRERREEALLKQRQEDEPTLAAARAEQEFRRREADQQEAALKQPQEEERKLADAHRWAEQYRQRREAEQQQAALKQPQEERNSAEAPRQAEPQPPRQEADERKLAGTLTAPASQRLAEKRADQASPPTESGDAGVKRAAHHRYPRVDRRNFASTQNVVCPWLGWLARPTAPAAGRTKTKRGAT